MSEWLDKMRGLLGKEVVIVLNREPLATAVGELLSFDIGGEVVLRDDEGFVNYCWPAIDLDPKPKPKCCHEIVEDWHGKCGDTSAGWSNANF